LEKARLSPPDLIVSDILMPVMDGYALCRHWKSDEQLKHIPFVFYTATYTENKDEDFALSLGADRFIIKPQEPDIFMDMINKLFNEKCPANQVQAMPLGEEMEFFRKHNKFLFEKLEKKMLDLEIANGDIRKLEERYRLSFEHVTDVISIIDTDLNILSISPSVERVLGYKPEDFIGRSVADLEKTLTPESFEQAVADTVLILKGETISATIYRFIAKDGTTRYGEVSGSPITRDGRIIGLISVARDITDSRQTAEKLKKSEEKYRGILENIDDAYYELDLEGNLVFFNEALILKTGYSREELVGMNYRQYMSPGSSKYISKVFSGIYGTGQQVRLFDYEIIMKSGQVRYFESWADLLTDNKNQPVGFKGMARDITARKQAEQNLQNTLGSLRKAFSTTVQVMVSAVEARDPYTAGHQKRTADLARAIATEMKLPQEKVDGIRMAGSIHDIGKLSIPAEILSKPSRLTDIEFSLIKEHARQGYEILKDVESPWPLAQIVYQHHERMNGSGYPRNLKGDEILTEARIMAVADVVESMASYRPYRPALGINAALEEIEKNKGILYDDAVADACLRLFREKDFKL
ncbi:MAG: hypothetical protein QG578_702, partial [Thermodesulfobacteriota bacterium]|nr:hypothetical protein [Thermodesulfobacteriota bacterium]